LTKRDGLPLCGGNFDQHQPRMVLMQIKDIAITNPLGLHARACAKVVQVASRFRCNVSLVVEGRRASARSIIAVMLLSASVGTMVRVEVDGPEEAHAMREIAALFDSGFGDRT
jgi:phosphocarrier protein HPr